MLLIVDDDADWLTATGRILQRYEAVVAGTIEAGLEAARLHQPLVVILDINLPDGLGYNAVESFLLAAPGCEVITVSGDDSRPDAMLALKNGAGSNVYKFDSPYLLPRIVAEAVVVARRQRREGHPGRLAR